MAFRGGRGRGRFGGGGYRAPQTRFELFPEIEGLGTAEYTTTHSKLIRWWRNLEKFAEESSPYYYEDKRVRLEKLQKQDIERYSTRNSGARNNRPPLWDFIKLDTDHMPAELARGGNREKRGSAKKVKWDSGSDIQKLDLFEKLEQKSEGQEGTEKKENEEEDDEDQANEEDEGEFSDEGDYEQAEYFDDDEDDYNMVDDNADEPFF